MDKVNRNPERQFDGSDLAWLLAEYLRDRTSRVSASTMKDYAYVLHFFEMWWAEWGPAHKQLVARPDFHEYARWLERQPNRQGEHLSVRTIDTALKRLRQFFRWAWVEEFFRRDYSKWIPRANREAPEKQAPDPKCLADLFQAADSTDKPLRNKAILAVLIGTAVRRTECSAIDIEHVRFVASGGGQISIPKGKGGKPRIVIFDDIASYYLSAHLAYLAEIGVTAGPLFLGRGGRLSPKGLYSAVKACARRAGLADQIQGPHDLRRMFATYWSRTQRGEGFMQPLALQMGHTDKKMTLHYSKQGLADVQETFTSPLVELRRSRPSPAEADHTIDDKRK
ncbi:MAG: tyrosine-type recombinase/integrase [Caldilineaceae bacterium]